MPDLERSSWLPGAPRKSLNLRPALPMHRQAYLTVHGHLAK
jgi:hypothetical protein